MSWVKTNAGKYCFAVEDRDGEAFEIEILPSDDRAREHLQSVWQRLATCAEWYYKKENPPPPGWVAWRPWKWCDDKRDFYEPRQKFVAWCGSSLAGILNVWPRFPSVFEEGRHTLYIEHVAASPGNVKTELWDRRYTGIGQALLAFAVKLSHDGGLEGRLSSHVADAVALGFYRHLDQKLSGGLFHPERNGVTGPTPHGARDDPTMTYLETTQAGAMQLLGVYRV